MKLLTIKSLLAASLVAYGATAINYCGSGAIEVGLRVDNATPGSTDQIVDCNIARNVEVAYTNQGAPGVRAAPMVMRVVSSRFGPDSRMLILGKESYDAAQVNATACTFIVDNNVFGPGAMVYVRGAFSPDTTISIRGNSFDFGYPLTTFFPTPPGPTETFASAVYLHDLFLLDNVAVAINSNVIKGNSTNGFVAVNAINFGGDVYYNGPGASIEVNNNDIDILCNATSSFGTAIGGDKSLYVYSANARFSADNNVIRSVGSSSVLSHPSVVTVAPGSGHTSFSNNVIRADTTGMASVGTDATYRPVIRSGTLNIQNRPINVWVANNTLDVTGTLASIGFGSDVTCGSGCAVYVKDNHVAATGADPRLHFLGKVELSGDGALWVTGNDMSRVGAAATASPVFFNGILRVADDSALAITGNSFSAASPVLMAELSAAAAGSFTQPAGSLFLCNNSFGGASVGTLDEVKAVTSTGLGNAATVDGCPAVTSTTAAPVTSGGASSESASVADTTDGSANATTADATPSGTVAGTNTTADPLPNNNNKAGAASAVAALGAAMLAVAAMLV